MGMNDAELTPAEQAQMRRRIVEGARRIRSRSHRRVWTIGALGVALAAVLAGGTVVAAAVVGSVTGVPAAAPSSTPTLMPTQSQTPSPTVVAPDPVVAILDDLSCADVLSEGEVSAVLGRSLETFVAGWDGAEAAGVGGLTCLWTTPDEYMGASVTLSALPSSAVPADLRNVDTSCSDERPESCGIAGQVGAVWIVMTVQNLYADEHDALDALWRSAAASLAGVPAPVPVPGPGSWNLPGCAAVSTGVRSALAPELTLAPADTHYAGLSTVSERAGLVRHCRWNAGSTDPELADQSISVTVVPGGVGLFPDVFDADARFVPVQGASDAVSLNVRYPYEGMYRPLIVTDGVNLLVVDVADPALSSVPGVSVDPAPIAAALLARL